MRCFVSALLLSLLPLSVANATVYVWRDASGVIVMTNHESEVPEGARDSVTAYATTSVTEARKPTGEGAGAALTTSSAPDQQHGPSGVTADTGGRQPDRAPEGAGTQRTLGDVGRDGPVTEATKAPPGRSTDGSIDPRSLLLAAKREPPQVFVSIVGSSTRPLSTSDRSSSAFSGRPSDSRAARSSFDDGSSRSGGRSLAGALSSLASGMSSMR